MRFMLGHLMVRKPLVYIYIFFKEKLFTVFAFSSFLRADLVYSTLNACAFAGK